jgi:integrase
MYRGQKFVVTCAELRAAVWTKEATTQAANQWWDAKMAEITRLDTAARVLAEFGTPEAARAKLGALAGTETVSPVLPTRTSGQTLRQAADNFLQVASVGAKPLSVKNLRLYLDGLCAEFGGMAPAEVNEALVERVYLALVADPLAPDTRRNKWGHFVRFVRYLWSSRLCELPRNLDRFRFKPSHREVKVYPPDTVRAVLAGLSSRFRLYALLGLNCGMTSVDIGALRKDQVDLARGRLVRKRVKTEAVAYVPTVNYALWPETVELLREHWSEHPSLVLTSANGTPLWTHRKDLVIQQWKRHGVPIRLKAFRSIGATVLETHPHYGRYKGHYLGHSPRSLADKHYAAPSGELFDSALTWLRRRVLGGEEKEG